MHKKTAKVCTFADTEETLFAYLRTSREITAKLRESAGRISRLHKRIVGKSRR